MKENGYSGKALNRVLSETNSRRELIDADGCVSPPSTPSVKSCTGVLVIDHGDFSPSSANHADVIVTLATCHPEPDMESTEL